MGKLNIKQDYTRPQPANLIQGREGVRRLAHDLEPLQLQQRPGHRPEGGVVVDDQHGLGHRLIVARAEGASHQGYPWFPIPTRQHPSMLRRCRGGTAGPLKELRRLRRGSSPTLGMQERV